MQNMIEMTSVVDTMVLPLQKFASTENKSNNGEHNYLHPRNMTDIFVQHDKLFTDDDCENAKFKHEHEYVSRIVKKSNQTQPSQYSATDDLNVNISEDDLDVEIVIYLEKSTGQIKIDAVSQLEAKDYGTNNDAIVVLDKSSSTEQEKHSMPRNTTDNDLHQTSLDVNIETQDDNSAEQDWHKVTNSRSSRRSAYDSRTPKRVHFEKEKQERPFVLRKLPKSHKNNRDVLNDGHGRQCHQSKTSEPIVKRKSLSDMNTYKAKHNAWGTANKDVLTGGRHKPHIFKRPSTVEYQTYPSVTADQTHEITNEHHQAPPEQHSYPSQTEYHWQPSQTEYQLQPSQSENHLQPSQPENHLQPSQTEYHLQPSQTEYHLQPSQTEYHLQPSQTEYHLQPSQTEYHLQPSQTEYHLQPSQTEYHLQPSQTEYYLQPSQTEYHLQPSQTEYHLQPSQTEYHLQSSQTEYHLQPSQSESHLQPTQLEYHLQPSQPEYHLQPSQPGYHLQPNQTEYHLQPSQTEYHLQPNQPGYHLQPNQTEYHLQPSQSEYHMNTCPPEYHLQPSQSEYHLQPSQSEYHMNKCPSEYHIHSGTVVHHTHSNSSEHYVGHIANEHYTHTSTSDNNVRPSPNAYHPHSSQSEHQMHQGASEQYMYTSHREYEDEQSYQQKNNNHTHSTDAPYTRPNYNSSMVRANQYQKKITILKKGQDIETVIAENEKENSENEKRQAEAESPMTILRSERSSVPAKELKQMISSVQISKSQNSIQTVSSSTKQNKGLRDGQKSRSSVNTCETEKEESKHKAKLNKRRRQKNKLKKLPKRQIELFQRYIETGQLRSKFSRYKTESLKDIRLIEEIHKGTFSVKYKASYQNKQVVLSVFLDQDTSDIDDVEMARMGNCYFILGISDCIAGPKGSLWFLTLQHGLGDLQKLLARDESRRVFGEKHAQFITAGVLLGVDFLHCRDIIHGNIKPSKILINNLGFPVLAGFIKVLERPDDCRDVFTPAYAAPERYRGYRGTGVDIFSIGNVAYEIVTGSTPFDGGTVDVTKEYILDHNVRPHYEPEMFSLAGEFFIDSCLQKNVKQRFDIGEDRRNMFSEEWFSTLDWRDFKRQTLKSPILEAIQLINNKAYLGWEEKTVQYQWGRVMDMMCPDTATLDDDYCIEPENLSC